MARIMTIDDEEAIRRSLRRILEADGHEVTEAADGQTALRWFAGSPTDLVISDIYMPHMDGIEFLIRLHEAFPEARLIAMSGGGFRTKEMVLEASRSLGAIATLDKPLEIEVVLTEVRDALELDPAARRSS